MSSKIAYNGNLLNPLPAVLVGANVGGKPNFLVISYICPFDFGRRIFFSLYKKRYTRIGIHENQTFSVNIPSTRNLEKLQICGNKSGANYDKSTLFDTFYGELKTAPMIRECPINIELSLEKVIDYEQNEGIIGKVVKTYVDDGCLSEGKLDASLTDLFVWVSGEKNGFYRLGEKLAER